MVNCLKVNRTDSLGPIECLEGIKWRIMVVTNKLKWTRYGT